MLNVSSSFITAIKDSTAITSARVYVYDSNDGSRVCTLNKTDFKESSLSISNSSSSGSNFSIGGVCIGTCEFSLTQKGVNKLKDADCYRKGVIVKPIFWIDTTGAGLEAGDFDSSSGKCKLGEYIVDSLSFDDYVGEFKCVDYMSKFDTSITNEVLNYMKDPANMKTIEGWLDYCCNQCSDSSVTLSVGTLQVITNTDDTLCLDADSDIKSYRDFISWLAVMSGSFATINRNGELILKQYNTNSTEYTIPKNNVFSSKFDSLNTRIMGYRSSVAGYDITTKPTEIEEAGYNNILLYIPEIPFLRQRSLVDAPTLDQTILNATDNIFNSLKDINYVDASIECVGNPALELGDCISVKRKVVESNGTSSDIERSKILISNFTWKFQSNMTINSYGTGELNNNITSQPKKSTPANDPRLDGVADKLKDGTSTSTGTGVLVDKTTEQNVLVGSDGKFDFTSNMNTNYKSFLDLENDDGTYSSSDGYWKQDTFTVTAPSSVKRDGLSATGAKVTVDARVYIGSCVGLLGRKYKTETKTYHSFKTNSTVSYNCDYVITALHVKVFQPLIRVTSNKDVAILDIDTTGANSARYSLAPSSHTELYNELYLSELQEPDVDIDISTTISQNAGIDVMADDTIITKYGGSDDGVVIDIYCMCTTKEEIDGELREDTYVIKIDASSSGKDDFTSIYEYVTSNIHINSTVEISGAYTVGTDTDTATDIASAIRNCATKADLNALERRVSALELQVNAINRDGVSSGTGSGTGDTTDTTALEQTVNTLQTDLNSTKTALGALTTKVNNLPTSGGTGTNYSSEITELQDGLSDLDTRITNVQNSIPNVSTINSTLQSLQNQIDKLKNSGTGGNLAPPIVDTFTSVLPEYHAYEAVELNATGTAKNGGTLTYCFFYNKSGSLTDWTQIGSGFGLSKTASLTQYPPVDTRYYFKVEVMETVGLVSSVNSKILDLMIYKSLSATLGTSVSSPQVHGTPITVKAINMDGGKPPYSYRFYQKLSGVNTDIYSGTNSSCVWTPSVAGSYTLYLDLIDATGYIKTYSKSFTIS